MKLKRLLAPSLCLSLAVLVGCSTNQPAHDKTDYYPAVTNATSSGGESMNKEKYTVIEFAEGDNELSDAGKAQLKSFVENARYGGKEIENIKILSWADQNIKDSSSDSGTDFDRSIASERSEAIEEYLQEDLNTGADYTSYNMAENKSNVRNIFKSEDWKRQPFSKAESRTLPRSDDAEEFIKLSENNASRALVVVDYE